MYPLSLNAWYTGIATVAHNARNREQTQLAYTIDRACKLWPAVENTLMNCWETISRRNTNACSVSCEGTMRGRGGTNRGCRRCSWGTNFTIDGVTCAGNHPGDGNLQVE